MNILIYMGNEPYPKVGGMERASDLLAKYLISKGNAVLFVCRRKNRLGEIFSPAAPILFLPHASGFNSKINKVFFTNVIVKNKIEIVIDQNEGGVIGYWGIYRTKKIFPENIKLISVFHNSAVALLKNLHTAPKNQSYINKVFLPIKRQKYTLIRKLIYAKIWKTSDAIVVLSQSFINDFHFFYKKANEKKIHVIPNINSYFNPQINNSRINEVLFVGRLDNNAKGIDRLLKIWKELYELFPDWKLTIVGDGNDRTMLEELSGTLKLKRISFEGFQDPEKYYQRAKIFCMTSTYEGFGLVLTEAMQHGIVPIAFNSYSSVKAIIENWKDGLIIEPFDLKKYGDKLNLLMKESELLNQMSQNALKSVEQFSFENIGEKWIELLYSLKNKK